MVEEVSKVARVQEVSRGLMFDVRGSWFGEDFIQLKTIFMARVSTNILLRGLSGSIGKTLVFKNYSGKTIVCEYPRRRRKGLTEKQERQAEKLKEAVAFARGVLKDEKLRAHYAKRAKKWLSVYHYLVHLHMKGMVGEHKRERKRDRFTQRR